MPQGLKRVGFIHKVDSKADIDKSLKDSGADRIVRDDAQFIRGLKKRR
ncbi:MAG: hypothetical protein PHE59_05360 [Patescibacteria group bacterium]|nr:hypothetical protein [Patescibacteria group bacterium]